jgi:hypothetical protein
VVGLPLGAATLLLAGAIVGLFLSVGPAAASLTR